MNPDHMLPVQCVVSCSMTLTGARPARCARPLLLAAETKQSRAGSRGGPWTHLQCCTTAWRVQLVSPLQPSSARRVAWRQIRSSAAENSSEERSQRVSTSSRSEGHTPWLPWAQRRGSSCEKSRRCSECSVGKRHSAWIPVAAKGGAAEVQLREHGAALPHRR